MRPTRNKTMRMKRFKNNVRIYQERTSHSMGHNICWNVDWVKADYLIQRFKRVIC